MSDIHPAVISDSLKSSPLYSSELAPTPEGKRTWSTLDLAAIWVGMAVCIPTYILASYMIKSGISWHMALVIIGMANLIITVPMVLNGHAGVKYGIPFPVVGRASFGTKGIHLASIVRAVVACGWFGVQTWIGGLAVYAIWRAIIGEPYQSELDFEKFAGFGFFWMINLHFIWHGTERIKWLEKFAAPILIGLGVFLIIWGSGQAGGFFAVLDQGRQLETASAQIVQVSDNTFSLELHPIRNSSGQPKARQFRIIYPSGDQTNQTSWMDVSNDQTYSLSRLLPSLNIRSLQENRTSLKVQFKSGPKRSSLVDLTWPVKGSMVGFGASLWGYLLWLTAMVGFWATMSLSIADITRFAKTQKSQVIGQFLGLPGSMVLYSFVGIFVTFAAVVNFDSIIIAEDAPWDPVSFLAHFENPVAVIFSQLFLIIATLSTNIAANVIAPANAFSNLWPKRISFRAGGMITAFIGILICPWWLLEEISSILIFVSGLLGPVLGILLADYFVVRKRSLSVEGLFQVHGIYSYSFGFNPAAMWAFGVGIVIALVGYWIPVLSFLYNLSWFSGFIISFMLYILLMKRLTVNSLYSL